MERKSQQIFHPLINYQDGLNSQVVSIWSQGIEASYKFPTWVTGPIHLGHLLPPFPGHQHTAGVAEMQSSFQTGCRHFRLWLFSPCHSQPSDLAWVGLSFLWLRERPGLQSGQGELWKRICGWTELWCSFWYRIILGKKRLYEKKRYKWNLTASLYTVVLCPINFESSSTCINEILDFFFLLSFALKFLFQLCPS